MGDDWLWNSDGLDAFEYAHNFVGVALLPDFGVVEANRKYLWDAFERDWFRPALELQIAGVVLLAGPLGNRTLAGSFAVTAVDHLIVGWNAMLLSYTRVAYTLSRHVAEAAIFEVAAAHAPDRFASLWQNNRATGGSVLKPLSANIRETPTFPEISVEGGGDDDGTDRQNGRSTASERGGNAGSA